MPLLSAHRQIIDKVTHANLSLSKGLGSRHWAGAAISLKTKAIAIVVSQSSGTVATFPERKIWSHAPSNRWYQAVKWQEFNYEHLCAEDFD